MKDNHIIQCHKNNLQQSKFTIKYINNNSDKLLFHTQFSIFNFNGQCSLYIHIYQQFHVHKHINIFHDIKGMQQQ